MWMHADLQTAKNPESCADLEMLTCLADKMLQMKFFLNGFYYKSMANIFKNFLKIFYDLLWEDKKITSSSALF
jgi:hypothetical protein